METKDTAVALLKEWKQLKIDIDMDRWTLDHPNHFSRKFVIENIEKAEVISRRLDEKAEAAGITNNGGFFGARNVSRGLGDFKGTFTILAPVCLDLYLPIETKELHAILEWLLIKNEEKTA